MNDHESAERLVSAQNQITAWRKKTWNIVRDLPQEYEDAYVKNENKYIALLFEAALASDEEIANGSAIADRVKKGYMILKNSYLTNQDAAFKANIEAADSSAESIPLFYVARIILGEVTRNHDEQQRRVSEENKRQEEERRRRERADQIRQEEKQRLDKTIAKLRKELKPIEDRIAALESAIKEKNDTYRTIGQPSGCFCAGSIGVGLCLILFNEMTFRGFGSPKGYPWILLISSIPLIILIIQAIRCNILDNNLKELNLELRMKVAEQSRINNVIQNENRAYDNRINSAIQNENRNNDQ